MVSTAGSPVSPVSSELDNVSQSRQEGINEVTSPNHEMQNLTDESGGDNNNAISKTPKKRMIWTTSLLNEFEAAINAIGLTNATPLMILDHMQDPRLTQKHVSSHLQKYRSRVKKQKESNEPYAHTSMGFGMPVNINDRLIGSSLTSSLWQNKHVPSSRSSHPVYVGESSTMPSLVHSKNIASQGFNMENSIYNIPRMNISNVGAPMMPNYGIQEQLQSLYPDSYSRFNASHMNNMEQIGSTHFSGGIQSIQPQESSVIANLESIVYGEIRRARMFIDSVVQGNQSDPFVNMNISADQRVNMPYVGNILSGTQPMTMSMPYSRNTLSDAHPVTMSTMNQPAIIPNNASLNSAVFSVGQQGITPNNPSNFPYGSLEFNRPNMDQQVIMPNNASNIFDGTRSAALSNMNNILSTDQLASSSNMMLTQPLLPSSARFTYNGDKMIVSDSNLYNMSNTDKVVNASSLMDTINTTRQPVLPSSTSFVSNEELLSNYDITISTEQVEVARSNANEILPNFHGQEMSGCNFSIGNPPDPQQ